MSHTGENRRENGVEEIILKCSWDDINIVIKGWSIIMSNFRDVGEQIHRRYLYDHPNYKRLFFAGRGDIDEEDYDKYPSYVNHSYALMKGLDAIMRYLSGRYEDDGEMLPYIGRTHKKRGIIKLMFVHLKEAIVTVCCEYLEADKKSKMAWKHVLEFVFEEYFMPEYHTTPNPEKETT